jgi:deazaflavin-dependent oxidoreductase (nitroreductase family)
MAEIQNQGPEDIAVSLSRLADQNYCYLTTTGRQSGKPHEIEIWFAARGATLYLLSGNGKSDWVKNLRKHPTVMVRIAAKTFTGMARIVSEDEEDRTARYLVAEKYQEWESENTLSEWARNALPVAIDLTSTK